LQAVHPVDPGMTTTSYVDPGGQVDPRGADGKAAFDDFVAARTRALLRTS
jgi:hypothetical protein